MTSVDPTVLAHAILSNARKHHVYGNGLMNVHIFERILGKEGVTYVPGFLNVKAETPFSVRHFYFELPNGEILDPTFFTPKMLEYELSNTREALYPLGYTSTELDDQTRRDAFYQNLCEGNSDGYWLLVNKKCVDVFRDVVKELGLACTVPTRSGKIGANEPCPCGSGKKYKKCHSSITF
jgi:hypothetical protein